MGCSHNTGVFSFRCVYPLLLSLLLLLSSTQVKFMAEGSVISKLLEFVKVGEEEKMLTRARIGSRPPSCERRCSSCGHCEAIQVPVVPRVRGRRHSSTTSITDDTSNYKPISWKCKCGDMILNP